MLISGRDGNLAEETALEETEQLIKNMFAQGEYRTTAEKNHINPDDIKKVLSHVILLINRQLISFTIALIMKPEEGSRDVYIGNGGMGKCYKINPNEVKKLTPDDKDKKEITVEKLTKDDAFLLCSCEIAESLDNKFMQQASILFRVPEEFCKRIIFASYNKVGVGNFSAAVFVERDKTNREQRKKRFVRRVVFGGLIVLLAVSGIVINDFAFKTKEPVNIKEDISPSVQTPPVVIKKTPHKVISTDRSSKPVKEPKSTVVKKEVINKNVEFMINGSVVMITNWDEVAKDVRSIHWESGQSSKNRIYKYSDYTQIPDAVRVTFRDNSTRVFYLK